MTAQEIAFQSGPEKLKQEVAVITLRWNVTIIRTSSRQGFAILNEQRESPKEQSQTIERWSKRRSKNNTEEARAKLLAMCVNNSFASCPCNVTLCTTLLHGK